MKVTTANLSGLTLRRDSRRPQAGDARMILIRIPDSEGDKAYDKFVIAPGHLDAKTAASCVAGAILALKAEDPEYQVIDLERRLTPKGFVFPTVIQCTETF